jgi:para-nitrobenzyl esterase
MVFLHGGAFLSGSGSGVMYRGGVLARRGVVVVTLNYRLGALGFLAHPALAGPGADGFGNWGLADQLYALRFVRAHAEVFGGDPANVTVFGESAGAISVCDLIGMPAASGLFRRAIVESGMAFASPPAVARRLAERLAASLELKEVTREAFAAVPLAELVPAQQEISAAVDGGLGMPFAPVVDGGLLPRHPADLIAAGTSAGVELLAGTNRDEFKFFSFVAPQTADLDLAGLEALVGRYLHNAGMRKPIEPAAVVERYRSARCARGEPAAPRDLLDAIAGDWIFRIPLLRLVDAHRAHTPATYAYRFDWESTFAGGALGACHALELPFVFGSVRNPVIGIFAGAGEDALALSERMQASWVAFATTGDPSPSGDGAWPRYETEHRATMVFGQQDRVLDAPQEDERRFWEERLGRYGVAGPVEGAEPVDVSFLGPDEQSGT